MYSWNRGVQGLNGEALKLGKDLRDLNNDMGMANAKGGKGGRTGPKLDQFDVIVEKLKKEIEDLFHKGIMVVAAPPKGHNKNTCGDEKARWKAESNKIQQNLTLIISQTEQVGKMGTLIKLMDIKDQFQTQLFSSLLYRKIIMWKDLDIKAENYESEKVV